MRTIPIIVIAAAATQLGSTDCGQAIKDNGFDLWCGDTLCDWKVERGAIQDVPTWHAGDQGVALVGDDVAIEQVSPVASTDGTCIELDLLAHVDANVDVVLNVDVFGDGTIDLAEHFPTGTWQPVTFQMRMPDAYAGVRFEIAKAGAGTAELANISAKIVDGGCAGQPALRVESRPLAAPCDDSSECASGICGEDAFAFGAVCVACDGTHACGSGDVCGASRPLSPLRGAEIECIAAASVPLAGQCASDGDCATGVCEGRMCSTCKTSADCGSGEDCNVAWSGDTLFEAAPAECAPGLGHRASGEPCVTNADCHSGQCDGPALSTCYDGRPCATDIDCPYAGLDQTACTLVGVQGGSCH
jgi:hypothetical protein